MHWRNRPWVQYISRKIVNDRRLGKLGLGSIWCSHPGAIHHCTLCKLNRQNRVEPVVPPPPPVYSTGPGPTEPVIPPPPPTHLGRENPGYVAFSKMMLE
jgi:hypothetical protein